MCYSTNISSGLIICHVFKPDVALGQRYHSRPCLKDKSASIATGEGLLLLQNQFSHKTNPITKSLLFFQWHYGHRIQNYIHCSPSKYAVLGCHSRWYTGPFLKYHQRRQRFCQWQNRLCHSHCIFGLGILRCPYGPIMVHLPCVSAGLHHVLVLDDRFRFASGRRWSNSPYHAIQMVIDLSQKLTGTNTCSSAWYYNYWGYNWGHYYRTPVVASAGVINNAGCADWRCVLAFSFISSMLSLASFLLVCSSNKHLDYDTEGTIDRVSTFARVNVADWSNWADNPGTSCRSPIHHLGP